MGKTNGGGSNWRKKYANEDLRIYRIYKGMKNRCYNKKGAVYQHYGAKGITICDEWLGENGALRFIEWSRQHGYADDLTIERIDVTKGYNPDNCRWATWKEQHQNTRRTKYIVFNEERITAVEASKRTGIPLNIIQARIRMGWSDERIVENYNHNYLRERNVALSRC